jgi:hypothetical protein
MSGIRARDYRTGTLTLILLPDEEEIPRSDETVGEYGEGRLSVERCLHVHCKHVEKIVPIHNNQNVHIKIISDPDP